MKILITGFIVFVIWSLFASWLYIDKILPAMKEPVAVQTIPEKKSLSTDTLVTVNAVLPGELVIYFGFDKVQINPDPQIDISIAEFKNWIEANPVSSISVTGHTDPAGTPEYNMTLGLKRAQAIQKYLEEKGFPSDRIVTDSKGEDQPSAGNQTEEGRAKNRRGEISIKK